MDDTKQEKTAQNPFAAFLEYFELIIYAVVVALTLLTFFFRIGWVDGSSMDTTMSNGDCYLVSGFLYTPTKGDIVVFEPDTAVAGTKAGVDELLYVKRIIATEGDHLVIHLNEDGTSYVSVNDEVLDETYLDLWQYTDPRNGTNELDLIIPEGTFFAMGDNRVSSKDSRIIGVVENERLIGKVIFRFAPLSKIGTVS